MARKNLLTPDMVLQMQDDYIKTDMSFAELGKKYGVTRQAVQHIAKRDGWSLFERRAGPTPKGPDPGPGRTRKDPLPVDTAIEISTSPAELAKDIPEEIPYEKRAGFVAVKMNEIFDKILDKFAELEILEQLKALRDIVALASAIRTNQLTIMQAFGGMTAADRERLNLMRRQLDKKEEADKVDTTPVQVTFRILGSDGEAVQDADADPTA